MSIYEEFNEIKEDYDRVKSGLGKNIELRKEQESELKGLGLNDEQIIQSMAPIDMAIASAQISIDQWESKR